MLKDFFFPRFMARPRKTWKSEVYRKMLVRIENKIESRCLLIEQIFLAVRGDVGNLLPENKWQICLPVKIDNHGFHCNCFLFL